MTTTIPAGWLPIESAPKDGTEIIIFHPQAGVCAAFCPGDGFAWHCMDGMNTAIGKKSGQSIPVMTSFVDAPTHWMPLPAAPGVSTVEDAPAAGDARDSERLEWVAQNAWAIRDLENGRKNALVWQQPRTSTAGALDRLRTAIDAAIAAQRQGDA